MLTRPFVLAALVVAGLASLAAAQDTAPAAAPAERPTRDDHAAEKLGWRLGVQAWTFRDRTAFEAIDTAHALGLRYIELFPGQRLAPQYDKAVVGVEMSDEQRAALLEKLAASNVKLVSFGVVSLPNDEDSARELFEFAKELGLETITCEPEPDAWDLAEKLADEYHIDVACHDHPKPSRYWNPDTVLAAVKGRSKRLGACADTGHWPRSGLDALECLKKLEGRIITLHFKDIAPADRTGVDQPWGTGANHAHAMLEELHRQGFRGVISIEYETGSGAELEANVAKCIAWFDRTAAELAAK